MKEQIEKLSDDRFHFVWLEEVDSTNEEAKRLAAAGAPHNTVVVAETQTKGKGRRGRSWDSPKGDSIYTTILLRPKIKAIYASMLTFVIALSAAEAVEETIQESCFIKWPNDLVLHDKKICGILTEMSADMEAVHYVVIGIGINVNQEGFPKEIASMATSLKKETGRAVDRKELLISLFNHFEKNYHKFMEQTSLEPLMEAYNSRLINIGRQVKLIRRDGEEIRISHGIDPEGALIVCDEHGQTEKIISGEVSVRGLYGYV